MTNTTKYCKTCGKELITDWDEGNCITCARDKILGEPSTTKYESVNEQPMPDKTISEVENHSVEAFAVWLVERFTLEDDVIGEIVDAFDKSTKYHLKAGQKQALEWVMKKVIGENMNAHVSGNVYSRTIRVENELRDAQRQLLNQRINQ